MFENQKVAIWGRGIEGEEILKYCNNNGLQPIVIEGKDVDLSNFDVVIKSPGVSLYNSSLHTALERGIALWSGTNIFMHDKPQSMKTIAITGTKGKSTTSSLLAHILKRKGFSVGYGGNIGKPLISMAGQKFDIFVAELSSYQCADLMYPFDISVVLNLYPEHIDWHGSHNRYYEDKLNLIRIRDAGQTAILNWENTETLVRTKGEKDVLYFNQPDAIHLENGWIMDGTKKLFDSALIANLKGVHNLENICAVLTVLKKLDISLDKIEQDIIDFEPLPHRLQTVAQVNGVTFVDDSISTTPETAIAALKAFPNANHLFLLVGGFDRRQDYTALISYVAERMDEITLVTLPITGSRIAVTAKQAHLTVLPVSSVQEGVQKAQEVAVAGDVILLSPAAPSYHAYRNFEERGSDFQKSILK